MLRPLKMTVLICAVGLSSLASAPASAQHFHGYGGPRVGVYVGVPLYAPYAYYPPAYYSYPPVVYAPPAAPPVYVERGDMQAPPQAIPQAAPQSAQPTGN